MNTIFITCEMLFIKRSLITFLHEVQQARSHRVLSGCDVSAVPLVSMFTTFCLFSVKFIPVESRVGQAKGFKSPNISDTVLLDIHTGLCIPNWQLTG